MPVTVETENHPRRWAILSVMVLSLLVVVLDNTILNVAMKIIADPVDGLGANQSELEWAVNSYTLVFAALLFTFGVVGDRIGRKRMLIAGLVFFGLTSFLSAFATTTTLLIYARAGMGLGAAAIMPATLSILTNVFSPRDRARAIGIWSGAVGIGLAIGPIVGGALLEHFWWGSIFLVNVPIVAIAIITIAIVTPESRSSRKTPIDYSGVLLSVIGLVALTFGIIKGGETGSWSSPQVWGSVTFGIAILVLFVIYESRIEHPVLDVALFKDRRFSSAAGIIVLGFFGGMGLFFFMTFYIQIVLKLTPLETGLLFLPFAISQFVFSTLSGSTVRRFGAKNTALVGMSLITVAFLGYLYLDASSPLWLIATLFIIQGAGMANLMPPAMETIMRVTPADKAGVGSAIGNTFRQVGGSIGIAVLGSVLSVLYRSDVTPKITGLVPDIDTAAESIASTYGAASALGDQGIEVLAYATESFIDAMHVTAIVSASIGAVGVLIIAVWFPTNDVVHEPESVSESTPDNISSVT